MRTWSMPGIMLSPNRLIKTNLLLYMIIKPFFYRSPMIYPTFNQDDDDKRVCRTERSF